MPGRGEPGELLRGDEHRGRHERPPLAEQHRALERRGVDAMACSMGSGVTFFPVERTITVLLPSLDAEQALRVEAAEVAGAEEAVVGERALRRPPRSR